MSEGGQVERLDTSSFEDPEDRQMEPWDQWVEGLIDLNQLSPDDQKRARAFLEGAQVDDMESGSSETASAPDCVEEGSLPPGAVTNGSTGE